MKRYPAYKDSGIEWSPQIPENWQARPVKTWFDVQLGKMLQNDSESPLEKKVPYLKALHVTWGRVQTEDLPEMWASQTQIIQYGVKNGDLLVCEGGEVGRSGIVTNPPVGCIIQNALHRVRARNNAHISYLMYVLFAMGGADWFSILCNKATIAHFTREKFVDSKIPLPSFDEQNIISSYLDRKTKEIDGLIAKKERMIELLREERAAVINQAVTKGLDHHVEVKDSGIEWLGEVPKSWKIKRLKYVGKVIIGLTYAPEETAPTGTLVLRSSNIQDGKIVFDDTVYVNKQIPDKLLVKDGDILVCSRNGSRSLIGKCAQINNEHKGYTFGAFMTIFRGPSNRFVYYVFNSTIFAFHIGSFLTATINQLTTENLNGIIIALPPEKEQLAIAEFLDVKTAKIDAQIDRAKKSVELLKEHRAALISEAVTGKIDVRSDGELKHGG